MELNLSIADYFMLHSMMSENDPDDTFIVLCQNLIVRYFVGSGIKIILLNPSEDLLGELLFKI